MYKAMDQSLHEEIEVERKKNLEDIIHYAKWEAETVKKLGRKWFDIRDRWLWESFKADKEMWRNPKVREALIKTITFIDKLKRKRCASDPLKC
ncbi:MAG: hypothetical protein B7O98_09060 [Zestosphaera tikiterensis]|uniref:Uncharacterized protein n=1 Tax=Zestosphaera tikiterensis TaxID=1973259 RepID=A0A2R7Y2Q3_9CREN|nr:MAG: hypothetical protein B7O98_09060 [Zestosphaera tikiterensis]